MIAMDCLHTQEIRIDGPSEHHLAVAIVADMPVSRRATLDIEGLSALTFVGSSEDSRNVVSFEFTDLGHVRALGQMLLTLAGRAAELGVADEHASA